MHRRSPVLVSLASTACAVALASGLLAGLAACDDTSAVPKADAAVPGGGGGDTVGGTRPTMMFVPKAYDASKPTPLVVVLHGYYISPDYITGFFTLGKLADDQGVLVVAPDGNKDPSDNFYWNATDACCDAYGAKPDDDAYLTALVAEIKTKYNVDPKRVFLIGHSNGAFMALRMACKHADVFAAAISIAGANAQNADDCKPSQPVSVLAIHGDADETIHYDGGMLKQRGTLVSYPSAVDTVKAWAGLDGCQATTEAETMIDLDGSSGAETSRYKHAGCPAGIDAELWTVAGGTHYYFYGDNATLWTWLAAHPRP